MSNFKCTFFYRTHPYIYRNKSAGNKGKSAVSQDTTALFLIPHLIFQTAIFACLPTGIPSVQAGERKRALYFQYNHLKHKLSSS